MTLSHHQKEILEKFESVRCKPGNIGLRDEEQKLPGTYNIHKCWLCGRKWHIYETPPICQEYRNKYPDEQSFISQALNSQIEVVREYFATYQLDLCENTERFRKDILDFLTLNEEEKK